MTANGGSRCKRPVWVRHHRLVVLRYWGDTASVITLFLFLMNLFLCRERSTVKGVWDGTLPDKNYEHHFLKRLKPATDCIKLGFKLGRNFKRINISSSVGSMGLCVPILGLCGKVFGVVFFLGRGGTAGVASVTRHQELPPCQRDSSSSCLQDGFSAGQSWVHQQHWWHLCDNVFKKE